MSFTYLNPGGGLGMSHIPENSIAVACDLLSFFALNKISMIEVNPWDEEYPLEKSHYKLAVPGGCISFIRKQPGKEEFDYELIDDCAGESYGGTFMIKGKGMSGIRSIELLLTYLQKMDIHEIKMYLGISTRSFNESDIHQLEAEENY